MDPLIYELWEITIRHGYNTRKFNKDGLISWNTYKTLIPDFPIVWKDSSKAIYGDLIGLSVIPEDFDEKFGMTKEEWERHHYLIQHGRIINKNPEGKLVRLLQIAYNNGQFLVELEKRMYPEEQLRYYALNNLNKVTTYIDHISKLPDSLRDELSKNIQKAGKNKKSKKI
jgi:hypothetical protein